MAVFLRWVFAVWELVETVGKQSRTMIWACFHIPAWSAFCYSTTAEMCKGNTFYFFWLRAEQQFGEQAHHSNPGALEMTRCPLTCLARSLLKKELLACCRDHSEWPRSVWHLPAVNAMAFTFPLWSDSEGRLVCIAQDPGFFIQSLCPTDTAGAGPRGSAVLGFGQIPAKDRLVVFSLELLRLLHNLYPSGWKYL